MEFVEKYARIYNGLYKQYINIFYLGGVIMSGKNKLSHEAYGGVNGEKYTPYVSVKDALPELTIMSILVGCIFAAIFAAANVYLALKVGMTIAAIIPTSILGTALLYALGRKSILESNMVAGIAGIGESLAGGIVFTLPAVVIWNENSYYYNIRRNIRCFICYSSKKIFNG